MAELTCGERVVRCFIGEDIDRVPYGVGLGWDPWGETLDNFRRQSGIPDLDLREHFRFDKSFALPDVHYGIYPRIRPRHPAGDARVYRPPRRARHHHARPA